MSVNQAMAQRRSKGRRERGPAWHREATRKAILEAARELIACNGLEGTSLIRVAEKAGFAPTTVYAYFVRKADLISAIAADDLSNFARAIADGFPIAEPEEPICTAESEEPPQAAAEPVATSADSDPSEESAPEPVVESSTENEEPAQATAEPVVTLPDSDPPEEPAPEPVLEASTESESPVTVAAETVAQSDSADSVVACETAPEIQREEAAVVAPVAAIAQETSSETGASAVAALEARLVRIEARRADPWLERRLREFERMLAALGERVGPADRGNAGPPVDARVQELTERFEAVEKRHATTTDELSKSLARDLEARETRQRLTWSELRTLALEISGRLEVLERDRECRALAAEMPEVDFASESAVPAEAPAPIEAPIEKPAPSTDDSYLAAARRAAMTAQTLAQSDDSAPFGERLSRPGKARTRLLLTMCIGLGVVLAGVGVALRERASTPGGQNLQQIAAANVRAADVAHEPIPVGPPAAALAGNARAQTELGLAYLDGRGVTQSDANAGRWFEAAAMSGEPIAQYWLATMFEHGRGERADPAAALRWYEASALQGNLKATYKLAVSYAQGWGTRQNYSEAARWFSRAAELGFVNAQFNLGVLYERGLGVPQSLLDAYKWYSLAAAQGDRDSAARIDALSSQLSAEDLATAREAVTAFRPQRRDTGANALPDHPAVAASHTSRN